jgi:hypothetical protein
VRRNRINWRAGFSLILSVIVLVSLWPAAVRADGGERLVLAFYYNWFDENTWTPSKVPDFPAQTYVSRDRAVMARHIDQAKSAGIDALVVNWWGPQDNNQTDTNLRAMLDEAAARGFRIAVDVDLNSPYLRSAGAIQAAMSTLLSNHANHSAYLKVDGKPVVFFYHQNHRLSTNGWAAVRNAVDPGRNSLWIEEGTDVSPLTVFDGHHLYSVSWANRTDMGYTANKFARLVRAKAAALGAPKIYVSTVMPGYDDRKAGRGSAAFALGREDGAYYVRSWQAAIGSAPDWIVINSFNEWREGTHIEPSQTYGNLFLDLTAQWSAAFWGSAPPPPAPTPQPKPKVAAPAKPKPTLVKPTSTPKPTPMPTRTPEPVFTVPGGLSGK